MSVSKPLLIRKLFFLAAPILASPLLFFEKEQKCMFVIVVMCTYWVTECIPMGITSLLPLFFFPFFEIMEAKSVSKTYFLDTTVLGIASLLMGNAVEEVNLHKRIALRMLRLVGNRKHLLLLGSIFVTGFVSMCVADMAACVMMVPIILAILKILQDVNHQVALSSRESSTGGSESFSMKTRTMGGADGEEKEENLKKTEESEEGQKNLHNLDLARMTKVDRGFAKALVMACATASLFGGKGTLTGSTPNIVFREQFGPEETVSYLQWAFFSIPFMILGLFCNYFVLAAVFTLPFSFSGNKTRLTKEQKKKVAEATMEKIQEDYDSLGRFSFAEGSVLVWFTILIILWMSRNPGFAPGWGNLLPRNGKGVTDATTAIFVVVVLFIWPRDPFKDERLTPILTWNVMKTKFSWQCVLLVAVGNAISEGVKASELSTMIGCFLRGIFQNLSPFWLQVLVQLAASIVSEFTSNTSTAGIFIPIMLSIAKAFELNPLYLVLPATFASSYGFMTPMATPANAVVYDTGILRLWEMCVAGFFLKIVAIAITALNFETLAFKVLKLDEPLRFQTANVSSMNCF